MNQALLPILFLLALLRPTLSQNPPVPEVTGTPLAIEKKSFDGVRRADLSTETLLALPAFPIQVSPNADFLYIRTSENILQKISLPDFTEERRITMTRSTENLIWSKEGLVWMSGTKERIDQETQFWVLDPDSLSVTKTIPAVHASWLCGSPASSTIVSVPSVDKQGMRPVLLVDLKTGRTRELSGLKLALEAGRKPNMQNLGLGSWASLKLTPDARYLFSSPPAGPIARLALRGTDLTYEDIGPLANPGGTYSFSADSKLLGMTTQTGSGPTLTAYVYKVENLRKPLLRIQDAEFLGFGFSNKPIVRLATGELVVLDSAGKKEKQINMMIGASDPQAQVGQSFVGLAGSRLVLRTAKKLSCIDFSE